MVFEFEAELEKLEVKENDTFLLKTKSRLSRDAIYNIHQCLDEFLAKRGYKNVRVLVLDEGMVLEKL
jgi:hypothetical protein